ncbi:hypothetical protein [Alkalibacillus aidingensis]|uniref:hypothetical protein n=1 Tax=Alkalibacillus aidingensis TaxID=2747607 RepID=UPI001660ADE1|nr:hypothetical protein [Alkalibacillus aidingensis]
MYFDGEEHESNFNKLLDFYKFEDGQSQAALYIASHPQIFKTYKDVERLDENSHLLLDIGTWNGEEYIFNAPELTGSTKKMCEFGVSLYNGRKVDLNSVFSSVISDNLIEVLIESIRIRTEK